MNVVVITNLFPNALEPTRSTFNEQQVLSLSQLHCVVGVIVPVDWRRMLKFSRQGQRATLSNATNWKSLPVCYPTYWYIPKVATWLNGILMFLSILPAWFRIKKLKPDVIFATWAFPDGFAAVLLGKIAGVKVVVKVHGSDVEILKKQRLRRLLAVWSMNRASNVVGVSAYLSEMLVELGVQPHKITVIYNGLDQQKFRRLDRLECRHKLGLSSTNKIILYVGNLKNDKGAVDLFNAFMGIAKLDNTVDLIYAGDGDCRAAIEQMSTKYGVDSAVRLLGKVSHHSLPEWMNAADVLCLPSHHEGVPNVLLEAAACGVPCVATTVGGIPEVVTPDSGLLVAPGDILALTQALSAALSREWDRNKVQAALQLTIGTWAQNAAHLDTVLKAAVAV